MNQPLQVVHRRAYARITCVLVGWNGAVGQSVSGL